jgi:hypothetical protein
MLITGIAVYAIHDRSTQDRFDAAFDPEDGRYSGSLPLLTTGDLDIAKLYYAGVVSALELERSTATLPHAPPGTRRAFVTGTHTLSEEV